MPRGRPDGGRRRRAPARPATRWWCTWRRPASAGPTCTCSASACPSPSAMSSRDGCPTALPWRSSRWRRAVSARPASPWTTPGACSGRPSCSGWGETGAWPSSASCRRRPCRGSRPGSIPATAAWSSRSPSQCTASAEGASRPRTGWRSSAGAASGRPPSWRLRPLERRSTSRPVTTASVRRPSAWARARSAMRRGQLRRGRRGRRHRVGVGPCGRSGPPGRHGGAVGQLLGRRRHHARPVGDHEGGLPRAGHDVRPRGALA